MNKNSFVEYVELNTSNISIEKEDEAIIKLRFNNGLRITLKFGDIDCFCCCYCKYLCLASTNLKLDDFEDEGSLFDAVIDFAIAFYEPFEKSVEEDLNVLYSYKMQ
mgnify:CR=1 FL=1